jgi:hypothetical protein
MATIMSGFKDGGQVIVPVPLEFTDIIRNKVFSPPSPDGGNFLCGGGLDLFWNNPFLP